MDHSGKERQIWQRVLAQPEQVQDQTLIFWAQEDTAAFRGLWERTHAEQARQLLESAQYALDCLYGIRRFSTGEMNRARPLPAPAEPVRRVLEKAYRRGIMQQREYTSRMADPRFGAVYAALARRQADAAVAVAAWLGSLSNQLSERKSSSRVPKR